jgi:hypothetical protein
MNGLDELFSRLWQGHAAITPQAVRIHQLLAARGETIVNDHIALRTFDRPGVEIEALDRAFVTAGYQPAESYEFADRKLIACHYEHPDQRRPKLFVSALLVDQLSGRAQRAIEALLSQLPAGAAAAPAFAASGRRWQIDRASYELLREESDYAAWLAAFGFCANHFTVSVNHLRSFAGLAELCGFLVASGFRLNQSGGEIKGSLAQQLEQSSTLADEVEVDFAGEVSRIPSCYIEFARRYPGPDGTLFQGFLEGSAARLFESTDPR